MSREDVIRQIVSRESRKRGLLEATARAEDAASHAETCVQFGTWETALEKCVLETGAAELTTDHRHPD